MEPYNQLGKNFQLTNVLIPPKIDDMDCLVADISTTGSLPSTPTTLSVQDGEPIPGSEVAESTVLQIDGLDPHVLTQSVGEELRTTISDRGVVVQRQAADTAKFVKIRCLVAQGVLPGRACSKERLSLENLKKKEHPLLTSLYVHEEFSGSTHPG